MSVFDAKNVLKQRVIFHIDLDSFYAQVEQVRLGLPRSQPLAVQQWQLLTAVNYAARAFGIKKMSTVAEAKAACPDITLVHTASIANGETEPKYHTDPKYDTHKISLDVYRAASKKIMNLLARFSNSFQRASVDEAYLDMTNIVNTKIVELLNEGKILFDEASELPIVDWSTLDSESGSIVVGVTDPNSSEPLEYETRESASLQYPENSNIIPSYTPTEPAQKEINKSQNYLAHAKASTLGWSDLQLYIGSTLCQEIRAAVDKELSYTCSAGIAHNKTLAKLCSALNKPNKQTILLQDQVLPFLEPLSFQKIRNLGGKLGSEMEDVFSVRTCGDAWRIPLGVLQGKLGEATGLWAHDIVRGVCHEAVQQSQLQKSIGANKAFRPAIGNIDDVHRWIGSLCSEIYLRLKEEFDDYSRWPKTFSIHFRPESQNTIAKSNPMPPRLKTISPDTLTKIAVSLLGSSTSIILPCRSIGIGCSGFVKEDINAASVTKFFKKVEFAARNINTGESRQSDDCSNEMVLFTHEKDNNATFHESQAQMLNAVDANSNNSIMSQFLVRSNSEDDDQNVCISCEKCGKRVRADDASLEEHEDFHVALEIQKEMRGEIEVAGGAERTKRSGKATGKIQPRKKMREEGCRRTSIADFFRPK